MPIPSTVLVSFARAMLLGVGFLLLEEKFTRSCVTDISFAFFFSPSVTYLFNVGSEDKLHTPGNMLKSSQGTDFFAFSIVRSDGNRGLRRFSFGSSMTFFRRINAALNKICNSLTSEFSLVLVVIRLLVVFVSSLSSLFSSLLIQSSPSSFSFLWNMCSSNNSEQLQFST